MEGGVHRGRWNKKAPVGTILLLVVRKTWRDSLNILELHEYMKKHLTMDNKAFLCTFIVYSVLQCMFTPTLTSLQPSEEQKCQHGEYLSEKGICCNKCFPGTVWPPAHHTWFTAACSLLEISHRQTSSIIKSIYPSHNRVYMWCSCFPGFKLAEECHGTGQRSNCALCPDGQYTAEMNNFPNCFSCRSCKGRVTLPSFWISFTSLICQCCIRWWFALFTFSLFSTFPQQKIMKCRNHHAKKKETLFVAVRTVITNFTSTQEHTSVSNVQNADLMKRKNRNVSLKIWQCNKFHWYSVMSM